MKPYEKNMVFRCGCYDPRCGRLSICLFGKDGAEFGFVPYKKRNPERTVVISGDDLKTLVRELLRQERMTNDSQ